MRDGLVAEFDHPEAFSEASTRLHQLGYTRVESWSPYAVRGVVTRLPESRVPWVMLVSGLTGALLAFLVQWWCNAVDYRLNVGGRPLNSIPAFIPIAFETAVLCAAVAGFLSILGLSRLPRLHHPMFAVDGFDRVSVDRFWLALDVADPRFDEADASSETAVRDVFTASGAIRCFRLASGQEHEQGQGAA
jgi:hypothetical protein